jgi:hypothetical protein
MNIGKAPRGGRKIFTSRILVEIFEDREGHFYDTGGGKGCDRVSHEGIDCPKDA